MTALLHESPNGFRHLAHIEQFTTGVIDMFEHRQDPREKTNSDVQSTKYYDNLRVVGAVR
ncbi:hypothetical protein B8O08_00005 [Klebsiella variicola]|nr:hypothetical protein B8O08_00005 [Klebsiella variicola]